MVRRVQVIGQSREYDGFLKLDKVRFRYEMSDGTWSEETTRLVLERGDAVGVLLYHRRRQSVLLVEQFRYPAYVRGGPGWLLEIVAGVIEEGEGRVATAQRELIEETGYSVSRLQDFGMFYPSPGGSSERIYLYLGLLDGARRTGPGGGLATEQEDIRLREIPFSEALPGQGAFFFIYPFLKTRAWYSEPDAMRTMLSEYGKTIIALQRLALHPLPQL